MQFERDVFVDGLLGIGKKFGGKSENEGKELETRLLALRKERDNKGKNANQKKVTPAPVFPWSMVPTKSEEIFGSTSTSDSDDITPITVAQPRNRGGLGSTKSKKKKKKK